MSAKKTVARLRNGLRSEARKRIGHIGELEARASLQRGRLSELYSGRKTIKLEGFLEALDALEVEHAEFFSRVLGGFARPEQCLERLEVPADRDPAWTRIERATRRMEASEPPPVDRLAAGAAAVAEVAVCSVRKQQRRLRRGRKYRDPAFARAYLEHLDALRYDHAEEAAKLAATVAVDLVPKLPGPAAQRLSLQCLALGVFGSARRHKGRYSTAARALRQALELARCHRLHEDVATLLQRASYLLKDFGQFERALVCLREALEIFVDLDASAGVGRVLVDRAMMWWYLGDHETVVLILRRALCCLKGTEAELPRTHLTAYQLLAYASEQLGELDAAERYLEQGARAFAPRNEVDAAKLRWLHGNLTFQRGDYRRAEGLLQAARETLAASENPGQEALVSLDIADVLLAQDRLGEACALAQDMARLLECFEANRLAAQAIVKLIRPALAGKLSRAIVGEARADLRRACTPEQDARQLP